MDIKEALKRNVKELGELGALVAKPMLGDVKVAAACVYEAAKLPGGFSVKIVSVLEDGGLLLIEWIGPDNTYKVRRVSFRNIANVSLTGRDYGKAYLADPKLVVEVFSPVAGDQRLEFPVLVRERKSLAADLYDEDHKPALALQEVAEAAFAI